MLSYQHSKSCITKIYQQNIVQSYLDQWTTHTHIHTHTPTHTHHTHTPHTHIHTHTYTHTYKYTHTYIYIYNMFNLLPVRLSTTIHIKCYSNHYNYTSCLLNTRREFIFLIVEYVIHYVAYPTKYSYELTSNVPCKMYGLWNTRRTP